MSTLKSVGNKLFKTELNSQRVELGIAEDLDKLAEVLFNNNKATFTERREALIVRNKYVELFNSKE